MSRAILVSLSLSATFAQAAPPTAPAPEVKAASTAEKSEAISRSKDTPSTSAALSLVDEYVQEQMRKHHIPGVSIAIVRDGSVIQTKGYGQANVELAVPATEKTVYQLASVSKMFTATAVMMLVEEGKLGLDDKVSKYLSDLPKAWEDVTIRQLLNHTSGIKSYTSVRDFFKTARKDYAHREILDLVAKDPLDFPSASKWSYSNTGYFLLGMLIEKVTGKTYGEFLDARIFKPLGMGQTRVNDLHAIIPNRAQGYEWTGKELRNGEYVSPTQPYSAGALVSSVNDLVKWNAALGTETLLKKSSLEQMWTDTPLAKSERAPYGFGWAVEKVNGHPLHTHGGGIPGFSTELSRYKNGGLAVIVLANNGNGQAGSIARGIAGRVSPDLVKERDKPIADNDPPATERFKKLLLGAIKGEADPELFTEDAKKAIVPRIKEDKEEFSSLGDLKTFELLEKKTSEKGTRLRYRAAFENETLWLFINLDKAGKIAGLGTRPEE